MSISQKYPRIEDEVSKKYGYLDASQLVAHHQKIDLVVLKQLIRVAIDKANQKSSRESFDIPEDADKATLQEIYIKKYHGDPASTSLQFYKKHYRDVGREQFRNRLVQKGRMNSGWRYQFLLLDCAVNSKRFYSVSDLGVSEADFSAVINCKDESMPPINLYVSVKNRRNTMGGQD